MPTIYTPQAVLGGSDVTLSDKERLRASTTDLTNPSLVNLGLVEGRQVRVIRSATEYALFTIKAGALSAGQITMTTNGRARLGIDTGSAEEMQVTVD